MEDRVNDLLDKLVMLRLEEVMDLLEDEQNEETDEAVYEAAKALYVYFGGELDEY
jgi:hypothetical protein